MKLKRGDDVSRGIVRQDLIDISAENENYVDPAVAGGRYYSHCDPCNKSFIRPGDLKRHNNYCHGGQLELRNDTLYPPGQHAPAHVEEEEADGAKKIGEEDHELIMNESNILYNFFHKVHDTYIIIFTTLTFQILKK